jgi:hypothetical protein
MIHCIAVQMAAREVPAWTAPATAAVAREPARISTRADRNRQAVSNESTIDSPKRAHSGRRSVQSYMTFIAAVTARKTAETAHSEPRARTTFRSQELGIRLATSGSRWDTTERT